MRRLPSAQSEVYEMEVGECDCGYHFGVDATYLELVGDFQMQCPSCHKLINTASIFPENQEDEGKSPEIVVEHMDGIEDIEIDCKRFRIPIVFNTACPKCGTPHIHDFRNRYLSYPCIGENDVDMYCKVCEHEWKMKVRLDMFITPVIEETQEKTQLRVDKQNNEC